MMRRVNVLIVPDEGGPAHRLNVPVFLVRGAAWMILLLIVGLIAAFFSYNSFIQKAFDWDRLAADNEKLRDENHRVLQAARELEESRRALARALHSAQSARLDANNPYQNRITAGKSALSEESLALLEIRDYSADRLLSDRLPTLAPLKGFISQRFFDDPILPERSHRGVDIAGRLGAPIVAATHGRVVFEGWTPYYGNCLMIIHGDGYQTFYGHCQVNLKKAGDEVLRGEPIALVGTTGHSSAPHLHYEIWKDGVSVDPLKFSSMQ